MPESFADVVVVGAGPAGLSAALILGRCRRRVIVVDAGKPRNAGAQALHGFLTRDGTPPLELLRIGREQLKPYRTVSLLHGQVLDARSTRDGFSVRLDDGRRLASRCLLLATGVVDHVPRLEGIERFYGRSVFHCPYCDGWEVRDQPIAIHGRGRSGAGLALDLTAWSRHLTLCTNGAPRLSRMEQRRLDAQRIAVRSARILRLEGDNGMLSRIVFRDGSTLPCKAMFFSAPQHQRSDLAARLGCRFTRKGAVSTGWCESTNVRGLFVAGDASRNVQLAIIAAAEGAQAAFAINKSLLHEELR
jgi:thioredoxin reductase